MCTLVSTFYTHIKAGHIPGEVVWHIIVLIMIQDESSKLIENYKLSILR